MKKIALLLLFSCSTLLPARAWWDPGHLLVAMIAYLQLEEPVRQQVDQLTGVLARDYQQVNDFIVLGPWPDDLKEDGVRTFDHWHYMDIPYNPDDLLLPPPPERNVLWAIRQMERVLSTEEAAAVEKARHLAFLVHFVGDLHQPLHSTTMYTQTQPEGNRGGNDFRLRGNWRNLHMLWDDACGLTADLNDIRPYGAPKRPIPAPDRERILEFARQLIETYPPEAMPAVADLDPATWARESHDLAIEFAYRGYNGQGPDGAPLTLQPGQEPSDAYLQRGREIAGKRIAMAGYRLGRLLNRIFGAGRSRSD